MVLNIDQRADGHMYVYLWDGIRSLNVGDAAIDLPLNQWIHIEAFYHHATDATGHVTFWQDGQQIIDVANVQTQWPSTDEDARQWSIDSYTNGLTPSAATIYVDDAVISTTRVGSGSTCDVNQDGSTNVVDVQLEINQALGVASCKSDFNKDGRCNVTDVQRVVNAVLGGACVSP